jgi:hypothetical protein
MSVSFPLQEVLGLDVSQVAVMSASLPPSLRGARSKRQTSLSAMRAPLPPYERGLG